MLATRITIGICLAAIVATLFAIALGDSGLSVTTSSSDVQQQGTHDSAIPPAGAERAYALPDSPASASPPLKDKGGNFAEMRQRFSTTDNYRSFVSTALARPEDGGKFYALMATEACIRVNAILTGAQSGGLGAHSQFTQESIRVLDQMSQRCAGLAEQFGGLATLTGRIIERKTGDPEDPLMRAQRQLSNTREDPWAAVTRAKVLADPYIMAMTLLTKTEQLLEHSKPFGDAQLDEDLVSQAAYTAACEIRGDCANSFEVAIECSARGCASADMREIVLAKLSSRKDREQYQLIRQWLLNSMR